MKKYIEFIITLSSLCAIMGSAAVFSWKTWAIPEIQKQQEPLKQEVKFLRFVITESVSEKRAEELMTKYKMINGRTEDKAK